MSLLNKALFNTKDFYEEQEKFVMNNKKDVKIEIF